jgi:signal transduction histidine kinase
MSVLRQIKLLPPLIALIVLLCAALAGAHWWLGQGVERNAGLLRIVDGERLGAQRLMRWLLELEHATSRGGFERAQRGLQGDLDRIDRALEALAVGGSVEVGTAVLQVEADALPQTAAPVLAGLAGLWAPIRTDMNIALGSLAEVYPRRGELGALRVRFGPGETDLNAGFERLAGVIVADSAESESRQHLLAAMIVGLTVLAFGLLLWLHARQLKITQQSQQQTAEILASVPAGLFLLDQDLRIGEHYSVQLETILQRKALKQQNIAQLLDGLVADDTLDTAKEFISLLFSERVNENLVGSLNPLDQVEIQVDGRQQRRRYLNFGFRRVREAGRVSHLMVSVTDITERVVLQQELDRIRGESDLQGEQLIEVLLQLLRSDPELLSSRVSHWRALLKEANQALKQSTRSALELRRLVDRVYRPVHLIKGEAAALQLGFITSRARSAEEDLAALRQREGLEGNDFLPVTVRLEELFAQLDLLDRMLHQLQRLRPEGLVPTLASPAQSGQPKGFVEQLIDGLSGKLGRPARVVVEGERLEQLQDPRKTLIEDLFGQLARNSLVHGLEPGADRARLGKPPVGEIRYGIGRLDDGGLELSFRDDGRGINLEKLRLRAVELGRMDQATAASLQPRQLMGLIFQPGFSTAEGVDDHAGHGVGLDIVADTVKRLGGRIGVQSTPGQATQFRIRLPAVTSAAPDTQGGAS